MLDLMKQIIRTKQKDSSHIVREQDREESVKGRKHRKGLFSTDRTAKDLSPDATSVYDPDTDIITHPVSQELILCPNSNPTTADSSSVMAESIHSWLSPASESDYWGDPDGGISACEVDNGFPNTINAFTETGQAESSIKVPLQRSYTGRTPIIPSSLADTPCATLGIPGLLDLINATLRTSHTLDTLSLSSVLDGRLTL
ncbi:uncharacterized protein ARMOST_08518 [Armillaria ostoyae]|uniref:Uncharacterized protein n=1 Tax=Armillaria ostoyae TaxID=47428 RepID=A0A284R8X8_ARMOS|nr:uncharacterized protein ARMOST_08518 [Armillaria ostoyae]